MKYTATALSYSRWLRWKYYYSHVSCNAFEVIEFERKKRTIKHQTEKAAALKK